MEAIQSEVAAIDTPEDPDEVSPLQRLNVGRAAGIWRKEEEVEQAVIIEIYRRTVDKAKAMGEKELAATMSSIGMVRGTVSTCVHLLCLRGLLPSSTSTLGPT